MEDQDNLQRLSKVLAQAGIASRRSCEEIILKGRVCVNHKKVLIPQTMVGPKDEITVDNKPVRFPDKKIYYILNKPRGYVCSTDPLYTHKVLDLFRDSPYRLFTVGRLDKDTTGLLIVTNDGNFANKVIHPSSDIEKEYVATVNRPLTVKYLKAIKQGTEVEGVFVKPLVVEAVDIRKVKIIVKEGKKREVRLLIKAADLQVHELTRTRIGKLGLGRLAEGSWRKMSEAEKKLVLEKGSS